MMSSETSTRAKRKSAPGLKPGSPTTAGRRPGGPGRSNSTADPAPSARPSADATGVRPTHLLILGTVAAATGGTLVAHGTRPANIVFVVLAILTTGLVALAVYRTLWPLASEVEASEPEMVGGSTRAALEREKTIVLRAIKELEFDRAMGKVSQADCDEMTARLRARAVRLIRQLDAGSAGYRDLIERELNARLGVGAPTSRPTNGRAASLRTPDVTSTGAGAELAPPDPGDAGAPEDASPMACLACGSVNDADATFCKACGTKLGVPA